MRMMMRRDVQIRTWRYGWRTRARRSRRRKPLYIRRRCCWTQPVGLCVSHQKTLNPVFNETFTFAVPYERIRHTSLVISVMDHHLRTPRVTPVPRDPPGMTSWTTTGWAGTTRSVSWCSAPSPARWKWSTGTRCLPRVGRPYPSGTYSRTSTDHSSTDWLLCMPCLLNVRALRREKRRRPFRLRTKTASFLALDGRQSTATLFLCTIETKKRNDSHASSFRQEINKVYFQTFKKLKCRSARISAVKLFGVVARQRLRTCVTCDWCVWYRTRWRALGTSFVGA